MSPLSNTTHSPLYMTLYLDLREKILNGEYPAGSRLPSEMQLSADYGVSRITSKHALEQLVRDGLIQRFPGKGSFVQSSASSGEDPSGKAARPSSRLIGLVMEGFRFDFGLDILLGIEHQCAQEGYSLIIKFSYGQEQREKECIEELLAAGVSGILLMSAYSEVYSSTIMRLSLEGFPVVFIDRALSGLAIPCVKTDHQAASVCLTNALIRAGHKHLVLAMTKDSHTTSSVNDRVSGYMQSCIDHELLCANKRLMLQYEDVYAPQPEVRQANIARTRTFLMAHPDITGIVALTSGIATVFFQALADMASSSRYAIASFDGPDHFMSLPQHHFYIEQDQNQIGRVATQQLLAKISGQDVPLLTHIPYTLKENKPSRNA